MKMQRNSNVFVNEYNSLRRTPHLEHKRFHWNSEETQVYQGFKVTLVKLLTKLRKTIEESTNKERNQYEKISIMIIKLKSIRGEL